MEAALKNFQGTVLFVSHDRYFVDQVADHLLVIGPDRVRVLEGNYATYHDLIRQAAAAATAGPDRSPKAEKTDKSTVKSDGKPGNARKKRRFPYRKVSDLESEIFDRETRVEELHAAMADPQTLRDGNRVREVKAEIAEQQQTLKTLYEHWEEATELNW